MSKVTIETNDETVEIVAESPEVVLVEIVNPAGPAGPPGTTQWSGLTGTAPKVPFDTTNGGPTALGELAWLASTESLALRLKNGENLDVGEETIYHVENNTGSTITKGAAVSYAGTIGGSGKIRVKPWNGTTDAPEAFMGFAMGAISTGQTGYVTAFGLIRGINTSAFSDGAILYANPSGTGLTATKPSETHVIACLCVNASNNGTILVRPTIDKVATWDSVTGKPSEFPPSAHTHPISQVTGLQSALDGKQPSGDYVLSNDARLTNSREWTAETISQEEAEAGTSTTRRAFTAERVFQAIAAWWNASAFKTKLDGIANGATANQADAFLLSRANHTGTQTAATISDFNSAVASTPPAAHTHPISQVVGLQNALDSRLQTQGRFLGSNVTRTSSTLTVDATISIPLAANSNYVVELQISSASTGGASFESQLRYSGTIDSSITVSLVNGSNEGTLAVDFAEAITIWSSVTPPIVELGTIAGQNCTTYRIFIRTATAGDLALFWANNSGTGSVTLRLGTNITATLIP